MSVIDEVINDLMRIARMLEHIGAKAIARSIREAAVKLTTIEGGYT